jgi:hypothetical protein
VITNHPIGSSSPIREDLSSVTLVDIEINHSKVQNLINMIFKPIYPTKIAIDGKEFNIVIKNTQRLIFSVPKEMDYPGPWSIGVNKTLSGEKISSIKVIRVPRM